MVQAILMILAQQLRMLDRPVDYRSLEEVQTAQSEREDAEKESEKLERDGGEGTKAERDSKKTERDTKKEGGKENKEQIESKKLESDGGKGKKAKGEKSKKDGKESKKMKSEEGEPKIADTESEKLDIDGGEGAKAERESKESESDRGEGAKAERDGKKLKKKGEGNKADKESKKLKKGERKRDGEKADSESVKSESDGGEDETAKKESKKIERKGEGENADRESEPPERVSEKSGGESIKPEKETEISGRESEKSEKESKKAETESEKAERDKGKAGPKKEKTGSSREKTGREKEKAGSESEKTDREKKKTEQEKVKSDPEKEKTGREKDKTGPEREDTEKEKTEQEKVKSDPEKEKKEKEKTGREEDKTGPEREDTEKEKTRLESVKSEPEKENQERQKEKVEPEREKTHPEKEKAEQEREKTESKKEKTEREEDEKEKIIPLEEKAISEKQIKHKPLIEDSFISITDKDKILVVEKLPHSRRDTIESRVGSIPVVTLSQFKVLEAAVKTLEEKSSPIPFPSMPDNKTLRDDIAKGNASLTDTMQAMQVTARVQAAEDAINRMAELLSDMASKGTAPKDLASKIKQSVSGAGLDTKAPGSKKRAPSTTSKVAGKTTRQSLAIKTPSKGSIKSAKQAVERSGSDAPRPSLSSLGNFVTHPQMNSALSALKDALTKSTYAMTLSIHKIAEQSRTTVNNAADKAALVQNVDTRIKNLTKVLNDHSEQLAASETNAMSQMDAFNGQLGLVKTDLNDGIMQFESVTGNTGTQALTELGEKYDSLVEMLDVMMDSHNDLVTGQSLLKEDMHDVLTRVEMLQEEKSDRDEMMDRLQDKADISALENLLPAKDFAADQEKIKEKLGRCHGKFDKQATIWRRALQDLRSITDDKSDLLQLLKLKEDTENQLNTINKKLRCLAYALGEPKAALLARKLSLGACCGSCNKPAIQEPIDKSYFKDGKKSYSKPRRLPSAYFSYMGAGDPCEVETNSLTKEEASHHVCNRWVGGSHTLLKPSGKRAAPPEPIQSLPPTKKFTGSGVDGRLYNMEEPLDPCQHCNTQADEDLLVDGAGDTDHMMHVQIIGGPQTAEK